LESDAGHLEWLSVKSDEIAWNFWDRYVRYLREEERLPPLVVERIQATTTNVLRRLEDPLRSGSWDRRGMVVGQVQSGKTGNYTCVICKAADGGYKLLGV